jgi:hypothetical protein
VAVAAVGFAGCGLGESDPEPIDTQPRGGDQLVLTGGVDAGPTRTRHGVPQGWARDRDGALAAAVSAVACWWG